MDRLYVKRKTVQEISSFSGVGLHSGKKVTVTVKPADAGHGIVFIRTDVVSDNKIKLSPNVIAAGPLGSVISNGNISIKTLEHFMSAIFSYEITDLIIEVTGEEIPILSGNARKYIEFFENIALLEYDDEIEVIKLSKPFWFEHKGSQLIYFPSDVYKISYFCDYGDKVIGKQQYEYEHSLNSFKNNLMDARTFCFYKDVEKMREAGLSLGGSLEIALVAYDDKYSSGLNYPEEPCRHKLLDLVGDLYQLGHPLIGHIVAIKTGHAFNGEFAKRIFEQFKLERGLK